MVLSDRSIKEEIKKGRIKIIPFDLQCLQSATYDLHLDNKFRVFLHTIYPYIDIKKKIEDLTELIKIPQNKPFILHPGDFVLGSTQENIILPDDIAGRLDGKSSLGRLGIIIHSTAGWFDPGWEGHGTLEITNVAKLPITLYPGMKIGQMSFIRLTTPVDNLYGSAKLGSKYKGQKEPKESKIYKEFEKKKK